MKIIFDENVPLPLKDFLPEHFISTVQKEGLTGVENGAIIEFVDSRFDVLILADKNLRYQQNLKNRKIVLIELPTNRWPLLKQLKNKIVTAVNNATIGSYTIIESQPF